MYKHSKAIIAVGKMPVYQKVQLHSKKDESVLLQASWALFINPSANDSWHSVDISFEQVSASNSVELLNDEDDIYVVNVTKDVSKKMDAELFGSPKAFQFLLRCLHAASATGSSQGRLVKLIIPLQRGYIVRSDIVPMRLRDSKYFETVVSFAEPLQLHSQFNAPVAADACLDALFSAATAGLLLNKISGSDSQAEYKSLSISAESDLDNRLSLPWILPGTPPQKTLVLVDANSAHPEDGLGFYLAAQKLGIKVVVLDNEGHWLEKEEHARWREAFMPIRLANPPEADFGNNIVKAVKAFGQPVDGIVTFADTFWPYIAEIAPQLGLTTASPEALRTATNKYLTSKFVGHAAYNAFSLEDALSIAAEHQLPYPLIVKPCGGWSSEGVSRADDLEALVEAAKTIEKSRHGPEFVIEQYCEGPEVDINFVLLDGEILFFEVCDDLPKSADVNGPSAGSLTNFHELNSVYPSALPQKEIDLLRDSFLETLLKLGIRDGIMHLEGRVQYSSVEYKSQDGITELVAAEKQTRDPEAWLIEINPRPLGMTGSYIVESTYGIDYWGLALLLGVGDKERVRALSQPYKLGPQYTCVMVFIPVEYPASRRGIFDSDDICADLKSRRPDLAKQISRCACLLKRGEKVPHPSTGRNTFLAYFNVFSREGRQAALELAKQVREEVRYSFI